ncbi:uncharacterized protein LOC144446516 [Glandiceps talaboti]
MSMAIATSGSFGNAHNPKSGFISAEAVTIVRVPLTAISQMDDVCESHTLLKQEAEVLLGNVRTTKDEYEIDRFKGDESFEEFLKKCHLPNPVKRSEIQEKPEKNILHQYKQDLRVYHSYIRYLKKRETGRQESNYKERFNELAHLTKRVLTKISTLLFVLSQIDERDRKPIAKSGESDETDTDMGESFNDDDVFYFLRALLYYQASYNIALTYYENNACKSL